MFHNFFNSNLTFPINFSKKNWNKKSYQGMHIFCRLVVNMYVTYVTKPFLECNFLWDIAICGVGVNWERELGVFFVSFMEEFTIFISQALILQDFAYSPQIFSILFLEPWTNLEGTQSSPWIEEDSIIDDLFFIQSCEFWFDLVTTIYPGSWIHPLN